MNFKRYFKNKQHVTDVDKMLEEDIITLITSPYASPIVSIRLPLSYLLMMIQNIGYFESITLNWMKSITNYPHYSKPIVDKLLASILNTKFMTTLDPKSGYFQISMRTEDILKTAFITKRDMF